MEHQARPTVESLPIQPLLQESVLADGWRDTPLARAEFEELARGTDSLRDRSERLYALLRKRIGGRESISLLQGTAALARRGDPVGARLLAALLDVHAPGAEMITRIHQFDSARRFSKVLAQEPAALNAHGDWRLRLARIAEACRARAEELGAAPAPPTRPGPRDEEPFPLLRRCLEDLLATLAREGDLDDRGQRLLIDLARLEVDAFEERVSRLAADVNPYLKSAVTRVLPLLCEADGELRSMREFIQALETGRAGLAFRSRRARMQELLDSGERDRLLGSLEGQPGLAELITLLRGLEREAIPIRRLAGTAARLIALAHLLRGERLRETELDLLSAVVIAERFERDGELLLPIGAELAGSIARLLAQPGAGAELGWPLDGFRVEGERLALRVPREGRGDRRWPDDLPSDPERRDARAGAALDTAEVKRLVMANLDNVSMTLGFLRNPKVVAVPGLVAMVAARCRTMRILEVIASDRTLYGGYANKDVPRTLLTSPCNISVKTLQKFIHVKYINRVDLQRMARDKAGLRREVCAEIQKYLNSLGA